MARRTSKSDFNEVSKDKTKDINGLRDKDNAQPRIQPPAGVKTTAFNLAPPGMSGIKTGLSHASGPQPNNGKAEPSVSEGPSNDTPWIEGRIVTMPGYTFNRLLKKSDLKDVFPSASV
ncbi:hypothetical protein SAMN05421759_1091 [Roseivivax lentus]|uniref:Uncharacterized protein n=1 Tax=Roseivivax lentus TaxID=633194 RepID=A0A1N7NLG4_9RHOB|nr:hypothetical protein [Roseivivax lentus]SIS99243.1 hypothetical protein SAMN05421759_1091 [Roseivivax lentus]